MPRCRGGRLICRAEEKSVLPPISISPWAMRRKPAMASRSEVLPEPEGPKIAVTLASKATAMSRSKWASGRRQFSSMSRLLSRAQQPFRAPDESERQRDGDAEQDIGFRVLAQLNEIINCQRQCLGLARNISRQQDGGAEFAEGARK